MNLETLTCPADSRYRVVLDPAEAFPDDPGQGTPALVIGPRDRTGTFACVTDTGELDGMEVPPAVARWLDSLAEHVDAFLAAAFSIAEATS